MAVSLLKLSAGACSLEFEPEDEDAVFAAMIASYGKPTAIQRALETGSYRFGGADFVYQNAWDEACLIAMDRRGAKMLERIAACLVE